MSCNNVCVDDPTRVNWCRRCEKCAFVFLLLSAWLPPAEVCDIFGGMNLLEEESLVETFLGLIGASGNQKSFECVGTFDEARDAFQLTITRYDVTKMPICLQQLKEFIDQGAF